MKKKLNVLTVLVFLTVMGSTAAIAGIFVTVPTIPRTRFANNRPDSNPLRDSVRVGCNLVDLIWTFKANAEASGTCPGFNVQSKIRWDWVGSKMSCVMSAAQTDGDLRTIKKRVVVTSCNSPNGIYSDTLVVNTPCQTPGGDRREFFAVDPSTNKTQAACEAVGWSFTSGGECRPNQSACLEAGGVWNFSNSACGPTQSDCLDEGGTWDSFASTCSGLPGPSPDPTPSGGGGGGGGGGCGLTFDGGGSNPCECNPDSPDCVSPILIDVAGNGFQLSNASDGVAFDIRAEGSTQRISWTRPSSDDAWLALDRNGNGTIDDGSELFGNFTPQPNPPVGQERNGFIALAEYDKPTNGGNGDGLITPSDSIFASLRLWQDRNHNGISEAAELISLQAVGLKTIELNYKEAKKEDEYGNYFRYRAKVKDEQSTNVSRWAWDVFLVAP